MTILQQIQKWSETLPVWQRDAIARLYSKAELDEDDHAAIYAHLKSHHGIAGGEPAMAKTLSAEEVAAPPKQGRLVQITAIKNLRHVNALAFGQRLPISPQGLSVIYGENGSGKSGYSRVLKKACRARDQSEPIHPNAREEKAKLGTPQAGFELLVDSMAMEVEWKLGSPSPEQLSEISIFDTHCARAYVDNRGDFEYTPHGLDILSKLVAVCDKMKSRSSEEAARTRPNLMMFDALAWSDTAVGKLLSSLSAKTKREDIERLGSISKEEASRFETLSKALAEPAPDAKAQALRQRASRFADLSMRMKSFLAVADDGKVDALRQKVVQSKIAKQAAELASVEFKTIPGQLAYTGSEIWKTLFQAARNFVAESNPEKAIAELRPDDACPLCQNPLQEKGVERLAAFDKFVRKETETSERAARALAVEAYQAITQSSMDLRLDQALLDDLENQEQGLAERCAALQRTLLERRDSIKEAAGAGEHWPDVAPVDASVVGTIDTHVLALGDQAKMFDAATDEDAKRAMRSDLWELSDRMKFADLKTAALDAVDKLGLYLKLSNCAKAAASTAAISRKSTEFTKSVATREVADALNRELQSLDVHELRVVMKPETVRGKSQFKLVLEVPGHASAKDILSEGEQRAIAIASFLAEVNLGPNRGGVIFDDPVSSLDHRRRWHVARRLVEECKRRQVIVLTHDIYFLCVLQQEAARVGVEFSPQCIRRAPAGFGVQSNRLPFDSMSTSKRVKALRDMQTEALAKHKAGDEEEKQRLVRSAYYHLRLAWERGVEEVLLQGAVQRFDEGVSTKKLSGVIVEDSDYSTIDAGMTKSSKFAHDPAAGVQLPSPHPDELLADIDALEIWRKSVEARKETVRQRRA